MPRHITTGDAAGGDLGGTFPNPTVNDASIDHGSIGGLTDDDHAQYLLLAGRSGGQTAIGGTAASNNLTLQSTSNSTRGKINLGASSAYDEFNRFLGIGTVSPISSLHILHAGGAGGAPGTVSLNGTTTVTGASTQFQNNFRSGDIITISGEKQRLVSAIASNTSLTVKAFTPGHVSISATTTVTGTSTQFNNTIAVGDSITINSETRTVQSIASNTSLTVTVAFTTTASRQRYTSPDAYPTTASGLTYGVNSSANALIARANGAMGVGSTPNDFSQLVVNNERIDMGANTEFYFHYTFPTYNPITETSKNVFGNITDLNTREDHAPLAQTGTFYGGRFRVTHRMTNTNVTNLIGGAFHLYNQVAASTATTTNATGGEFFLRGDGGTVTNAFGGRVLSPSGSVVMTTIEGIAVQNQGRATSTNAVAFAAADTVNATNNTNLLLGTLTPPSGNWSIYNSSTKQNAHAGNTKLGSTSAPTSVLDVAGPIATAISTKTANYTITATDSTILVDATSGNITITLPAVSGTTGRQYVIKKIDSSVNTVTIDGNSSETIDGATTQSITTQWDAITIQSNGSAWFII